MRIVLLGANGQLGRVIFSALCSRFPDSEILACVRRNRLHFEGVVGNTRQHSFAFDPLVDDWKTLGSADVLINCIGAIDERIHSFEKVHVLPVLRLSDHFEMLGKPRVIQVSAMGASPFSMSAFQRTKAFAEELVLRFPGSYVVRPSIVCTRGTMLAQRLKQFAGRRVFFPEHFLRTKIQPVAPADLADVVCRLVQENFPERVINVAGPEEISVGQLLNTAAIRPVMIPRKLSLLLWKLVRPFVRSTMSDEQFRLLGESNTGDTSAMEKLLGRKPAFVKSFWKEELKFTPKKKHRSMSDAFGIPYS
jgi:NADH dehydrogenase